MVEESCQSSGSKAPTILRAIFLACLSLLITSCTSQAPFGTGTTIFDTLQTGSFGSRKNGHGQTVLAGGSSGQSGVPIIDRGTEGGATFDLEATDPELAKVAVTLSFVDTDVREFARVLFSELIKRPYTIDDSVAGKVTLRSGGNVDGNAALALARQALSASGNTIRLSQGIYRVTNGSSAGIAGNLTNIRLKHINSESAQQALSPLLNGRAEIIAVNDSVLSLKGDPEALVLAEALVQVIDVDQFKSSSFGLFPLTNSDAADVSAEIDVLYRGAGVSGVTLLPIERLNALLIITKRASHLDFAVKWIKRLDTAAPDEARINIYKVQHRRAEDLAGLLTDIFSGSGASIPVSSEGNSSEGQSRAPIPAQSFAGAKPASKGGIRVTADTLTNTLIIKAQPAEYELVRRALYRLDIPLKQVYVEATIAEVRLDNELSHGVRWFLESGIFSGSITDNAAGTIGTQNPGFNFSINVPKAQIVLSALESYTDVRIISSPTLTVIDRETATIQVGDQVPIITKSVQDSSSGANVIASDVELKDTGVILRVTPTIRESGDVILQIEQEVSRVVPTTSSQINSPTISQRKVASTVSVPDGTAIVLGGLINGNDSTSSGGLPGTQRTILESLFGSKTTSWARSELLIIIRPVIIEDQSDLRAIVREIAEKMPNVLQVQVN